MQLLFNLCTQAQGDDTALTFALNQLKYWEHLKLKFTVKILQKAVWMSSLLLKVLEKL